jgi:hypothetical protein
MGFEQFGIVSFTDSTKADKFVDYLKENDIRGTVCSDCGKKFFPPRADCDACLSNNMEWFPISGEGSLITFTKATFAPAGFEKDVPYMMGVAEFPDHIKVFGRLDKDLDESEVSLGMKVRLKVLDLGEDRYSYAITSA